MIEGVRRTFTRLGRKTLRSSKDHRGHLTEFVPSANGQSQELDSIIASRSSTSRSELSSKYTVTNGSSVTAEIDSKVLTELATDSGRPAELDSGATPTQPVSSNSHLHKLMPGRFQHAWKTHG